MEGQIPTNPPVKESKYTPLTFEEYQRLSTFILDLGGYLPDSEAGYVWSTFNRLREINEPQPCTCASSGAHWKRAVDYLYRWVKERQ
jgi:hypothetical protein